MATVLILGAGSSVAQASSFRPKLDLEHPPLDANFFAKANALSKKHRGVRTTVRDLKQKIRDFDEFPDPFDEFVGSMEEYFADVYYEVASGHSRTSFPVYVELLRLYNRVLAATTNWMSSYTRLGAIDRLLRGELPRADGGLTVITFNQDLLIENSVARLPYAADGWCLRSLYGSDELEELVPRDGTAAFRCHEDNCSHEPPLKLLKLHGSLNWALRTTRIDPSRATLFPTPEKNIFLSQSRNVGEVRVSARRPGGRPWYLWPLVVPVTGTGCIGPCVEPSTPVVTINRLGECFCFFTVVKEPP